MLLIDYHTKYKFRINKNVGTYIVHCKQFNPTGFYEQPHCLCIDRCNVCKI